MCLCAHETLRRRLFICPDCRRCSRCCGLQYAYCLVQRYHLHHAFSHTWTDILMLLTNSLRLNSIRSNLSETSTWTFFCSQFLSTCWDRSSTLQTFSAKNVVADLVADHKKSANLSADWSKMWLVLSRLWASLIQWNLAFTVWNSRGIVWNFGREPVVWCATC